MRIQTRAAGPSHLETSTSISGMQATQVHSGASVAGITPIRDGLWASLVAYLIAHITLIGLVWTRKELLIGLGRSKSFSLDRPAARPTGLSCRVQRRAEMHPGPTRVSTADEPRAEYTAFSGIRFGMPQGLRLEGE
ncbi:hypothetical protein CMUS01_10840 [Colletotrichum musicola]|uniref:Uncharacterized protein n=1 Tax=Colletotrichum musicola TaxID=2175873 RepID=A0A8H6N889_9PEZI|nr:hypothetical protein CMUS01_10840 [Colletotrichum musicola]